MALSASSCRWLQTPLIAVRNALLRATERNDDASVWAVVHVLIEQAISLTLAPNQADGIDIEEERCFATHVAGTRIEHPCPAECQFDLVQPLRVLVQ